MLFPHQIFLHFLLHKEKELHAPDSTGSGGVRIGGWGGVIDMLAGVFRIIVGTSAVGEMPLRWLSAA